MKPDLPTRRVLSMGCGVLVIGIIDLATPWNFTGWHPDGWNFVGIAIAVFWYGLVGQLGGLAVYEIMRRAKARRQDGQKSNLTPRPDPPPTWIISHGFHSGQVWRVPTARTNRPRAHRQ
jgi:hypothetical protein